ncbi:MAG: prepilin-type N-terminal cleavage/methylation domain-containing protein [Candidatus Omnitrophica bacterium]|nr:prepilin-type N-terminal cleavage/methylation domain-containing protein [Candidatus Omnitrophota bacterium]
MAISEYNFGFTLLELLLVVLVAGILAAVAIPQFTNTTDRSRETQARSVIDIILAAEAAYYREHGVFTATLSELPVSVPVMADWLQPNLSHTGGTVVTVSINGNQTGHNHAAHFIQGILTDTGSKIVTNQNGR